MKKLKELTDKIAAEHGLEWYQPLQKAEDSAGMTAIDLGNGYSLHHEHSENGHDIWSVGYNGERAGTFMLRTEDTRRGKPMVAWAGLEKAHRGKGVGTLAYKALAAHYGGLDSDKASSSDDAIKAWVRAGGRQMKIKTQFGKPRYTLDGDKKNPPIMWNEDLVKTNSTPSLHLINKFDGSEFSPTEYHYSVKHNGQEIGRAIVFDKDPRSIHQAGKTGPSLKDIRLNPAYHGQGHSQGIINKLVDMHGPLASDSRGNISPAGAKMFHKYGIKQPDESYMLHGQSLKKSSDIGSLIQQAKSRLEGVKKVASQEPRPMIFSSKDGKNHGFVTVDPSKQGQWRVTHFVNGKPAGHTEAPTFSHAIKAAHESGYNVFKEIPEEEMFNAESLIKAAHPSDLKKIANKTNPKAQEIVDAAPHAVHAPDQSYVDFLNHPKVQKGLGSKDVGGISAKMVHKVGDDTYMAKPYHKRIESATRNMNPHPISGWSTMATKNLFHAAGIGHLCEDVSFHEHNGVPMTVHKFAKDAQQIADPNYNSTFKHRIKNSDIEAEAKKIAVMDFLTNNVDRHGGNVMFRPNKDGTAYNLLAIDHERGFQYNQPASIRYRGSPAETPRAYLRHTGLSDAAPFHSWMDDEEASYMPEGHTTKDWWKANRDNIVNSFNKDIESIKDPHLKKHIHTNFMRRVDWLDEFSHPDHYSFFSQHNNPTPVKMFKERRPKTDYKAIMKNLPENPYKAIGVIDGLFAKKLSFATKETLADLWNKQVDKMSGEEIGNYLRDIQKTKNHPHPKGAYWSLMNRLAQENHRQGMQHLVQNNMIDLPYWKEKFEAVLKLGAPKKP